MKFSQNKKNAQEVKHLLYVDDLLITCRANEQNAEAY